MAISLTTQPQQIAFSKNPIPVTVTSDNYIATQSVTAVIQIIFKAAITAGTVIPLMWAGANINMVAAAVPNDSGTQFLSGNGSAAYVQSLLPAFQDNPYIDADYTSTYALAGGLPAIILTAKNAGVLYNISPNESSSVKVNLATAGVNLDLLPNFAHHLEVWVKLAEGFTRVYSNNLQLEPNAGTTSKDIGEILHPYLMDGTDKPNLTVTTPQACTNTLREYYLKIAQYYGETPLLRKIFRSAHFFVNAGGLDVQSAFDQTLLGYLRPNGSNADTLCLRQGSKIITIRQDQPEFLYWINLSGSDANVKIRTEVFFEDGGSTVVYSPPYNVLAWKKYYLPTGYNATGIEAFLPEGKKCISYSIRFMTEDGYYLSAIYTYVIDHYREWPRYFIYRNSLGGFQTLYTWGKGQKESERTKDDIKKLVTYTEAASGGASAESNIRLQLKETVYTGYRIKRDLQLLDDFLLSAEKYLVSNNRLIPIGISTESIKYPDDGDILHGASFVYNPLYDEIVFTDDTNQPDNPDGTGATSNILHLTNYEHKQVVTPGRRKLYIVKK